MAIFTPCWQLHSELMLLYFIHPILTIAFHTGRSKHPQNILLISSLKCLLVSLKVVQGVPSIESLLDWYYCPDYCPHYLQKELSMQIHQKNCPNWTLKRKEKQSLYSMFFLNSEMLSLICSIFQNDLLLAFIAFLSFCWTISRMWVISLTLKTCFATQVVTTVSTF